MRIIGGIAAGKILQVPKGLGVRPTPDLVKQAIFNSLGPRIQEARVLDLFSGSGALGLESLSRGASQVLSVEKSSKHARWIKGNISKCGMPTHRHRMKTQDVFTLIPQLITLGERFDLIMADPPFGDKNRSQRSTSLSQKLLDLENMPSLLKPDGMFLLGHAKRDELSLTPWWVGRKTMKHGDSIFEFLTPAVAWQPTGDLAISAPSSEHSEL